MLALGGEEIEREKWGRKKGSQLSPAESSWRSLAVGEATTRQGPLWHTDGNFYNCCQAHLYILLSSYRCCAVFTAASPAQPGGTFTTVLYGQIICTIKGFNDDMEWLAINYGIAKEDSITWLKTHCSSLMFAPRRCYRVTFGTMGLFFSSFRHNNTDRSQLRDEMQQWSNERQKKHIWTCPEQCLTHIFYATKIV